AKAVRNQPYDKAEFPSMRDGVRGMNFIETSVASHKEGNVWKEL
ncbi:MAG TPA: oxidoreductase, partial [Flavobacteriaceae bacterium]|nr:oxidoreductase [Flavobacteriaceae bacterium]